MNQQNFDNIGSTKLFSLPQLRHILCQSIDLASKPERIEDTREFVRGGAKSVRNSELAPRPKKQEGARRTEVRVVSDRTYHSYNWRPNRKKTASRRPNTARPSLIAGLLEKGVPASSLTTVAATVPARQPMPASRRKRDRRGQARNAA